MELLTPRGLSRREAAHYVGVGVTLFDRLVAEGKMPRAKHIGRRTVWDRHALDAAFEALDDAAEEANPWDEDAA